MSNEGSQESRDLTSFVAGKVDGFVTKAMVVCEFIDENGQRSLYWAASDELTVWDLGILDEFKRDFLHIRSYRSRHGEGEA